MLYHADHGLVGPAHPWASTSVSSIPFLYEVEVGHCLSQAGDLTLTQTTQKRNMAALGVTPLVSGRQKILHPGAHLCMWLHSGDRHHPPEKKTGMVSSGVWLGQEHLACLFMFTSACEACPVSRLKFWL